MILEVNIASDGESFVIDVDLTPAVLVTMLDPSAALRVTLFDEGGGIAVSIHTSSPPHWGTDGDWRGPRLSCPKVAK